MACPPCSYQSSIWGKTCFRSILPFPHQLNDPRIICKAISLNGNVSFEKACFMEHATPIPSLPGHKARMTASLVLFPLPRQLDTAPSSSMLVIYCPGTTINPTYRLVQCSLTRLVDPSSSLPSPSTLSSLAAAAASIVLALGARYSYACASMMLHS